MSGYIFPVAGDYRVSSGIGSRAAPMAGASTNHQGIDIAANRGTPVVAPLPLEVVFAGTARGYGNAVYGVDASGNQYRFAHLDSFNVHDGDMLQAGAMLGRVGSTGNSTGNHLHFEVRDKAGNLLRNATNEVVSRGRSLAGSTIDKLLKANPMTAPFAAAADFFGFGADDIIGGGDSCGINPVCHLQKWFEETAFVQRFALFIVAVVLIIGGIGFLGKGYALDAVKKGIAK